MVVAARGVVVAACSVKGVAAVVEIACLVVPSRAGADVESPVLVVTSGAAALLLSIRMLQLVHKSQREGGDGCEEGSQKPQSGSLWRKPGVVSQAGQDTNEMAAIVESVCYRHLDCQDDSCYWCFLVAAVCCFQRRE